MDKAKIAVIAIIILLAGNIFFIWKYRTASQELAATKNAAEARKANSQVLAFANLFIEKVLQSGKEVDFETRLMLENSVRDLNDKEILAQWQKFTQAKDQVEAQSEVKNLLKLLVQKIKT